MKDFTGGFIPKEQKEERSPPGELKIKNKWKGESDKEESLSDPRWHRRPPSKRQSESKTKPEAVKDTRENIKRKPATFPKIVFTDSTEGSSKKTPPVMKVTSTTATKTTTMPVNAIIQTDLSIETKETYEYCVSRVAPNASIQEELLPNTEPPTMTTTQLEASHNLIVNEIVATIDRETNTEEEDTPLYRRKLQKFLGVNFIAAAARKDKNLRPLVNFVRKRDWDAL